MAEKYIKSSECEKYFYEHLDDAHIAGAMNAIDEMPAADVEPVRRGEWIIVHEHTYLADGTRKDWDNFFCSECYTPENAPRKFCAECGAKMEEYKSDIT